MAYRFNPPPGWPQPPEGWRPPEGWQPDPSWPAAPDGWQYWVVEEAPTPDGGAGPEGSAVGSADAQAPGAPDVDGGSAAGDASRSDPGADVDEVAATRLRTPGEPDPSPSADEPTQQFPAAAPTQQMPQWGGVPQQPVAGQQGPQQPGMPPPGAQPGMPPGAQPGMPPPGVPYSAAPPPGGQPGTPPGGQPGMPPGASYSTAPPPGSGPQFGGPTSSQGFQQADPFGGGPPAKTNRTPLIVGGIAGVIVLALLVVLGIRLLGDDDEPAEADSTPSATAPSTDPADDPTTPAPTDDPTDGPSDQPTDDPTDPSGPSAGNVTALGPGEPATVVGVSGEPEVEVALVSTQRNFEPEGQQAAICPDPAGEYIALEFEFTTLPALADGSGTYSFLGFEVGLANDNGTALETNGVAGLFCLGTDQRAPSEVGPGETFTGWVVVDAPAEASQVLWNPWLDFTGGQPTYAWSMSDF